jgi:hypothetical protein
VPFAKSKKAGIHNKTAGNVKNIDSIKNSAEIKSIALKTFPIKTNSPLRNKSPAQNNRYCAKTLTPKISIKNAIADAMSIAPRILTSIKRFNLVS